VRITLRLHRVALSSAYDAGTSLPFRLFVHLILGRGAGLWQGIVSWMLAFHFIGASVAWSSESPEASKLTQKTVTPPITMNGPDFTELMTGDDEKWPDEACKKPRWQISEKELRDVLLAHQQWLGRKRSGPGRAELCNAVVVADANVDLNDIDLSHADLRGLILQAAQLKRARFFRADLRSARPNDSHLQEANLSGANADHALFLNTELDNANFFSANVSSAQFISRARGAFFNSVEANHTDFSGDLTDSALMGSFKSADFTRTKLNKVTFYGDFSDADFSGADVSDAEFLHVNLTGARYTPISAPPSERISRIEGLTKIVVQPGQEAGLVQLREILKKLGLRDLERQATFRLEETRTQYELKSWRHDPALAAGAALKWLGFDLTTQYGLRPSRSILVLFVICMMMAPIYWLAIGKQPGLNPRGLFIVPAKDRVVRGKNGLTLESQPRPVQLDARGIARIGWAAYVSLLFAFNIGFREITIGSWISRLQRKPYFVEPLGWVGVAAGIQAILSVYLLAMAILTYFGRPFD
jgi:Pentapeptide repeats (8 copies)